MHIHRLFLSFVLALVACNEPTHQGRYLSSWIRDLDSSQDYKRRQACEAIAEMGPAAAAAVPELIELLDDVNPGVQEFARDALATMGPATIPELMRLLIWQFSKPVFVANLIAWPLAWYFLNEWLSGFALRISISPLYFIIAGLATLLMAWITVGGLVYRVAKNSPVHALRCE